jgi:pimeloyl-ACP methyl ester carboxylesterase
MQYITGAKVCNNINIAYKQYGHGDQTIFCIPPFGTSSSVYTPLLQLIPEDIATFIAFDIPGWGGNSQSLNDNLNFDEYLSIVARFIDDFDLKKYYILGCSFGGLTTAHLINKKMILPDKAIIISGIYSPSDLQIIKYYYKFVLQAYKFIVKYRFIKLFFAICVQLYYRILRLFKSHYRNQSSQMQIILDELWNADLSQILSPAVTMPKVDTINMDFDNKIFRFIISKNDYGSIKTINKRIASKNNIPLIEVDTKDHTHIYFEPEKIVSQVLQFINK